MRAVFDDLELSDKQKVEEFKQKLREQLNSSKDSWLVGALYDYFASTNSLHAIDLLVNAREPHDKHLLEKIHDGIKGKDKLHALNMLGQIIRRQPLWLHKLSQQSVLRELLRLLKNEVDAVIVICALIILDILLPLIPASIGQYLSDIFEIFSRFAAWNTNNSNKLPDGQLLHLQVALYSLFHRLYGMFPCHFLSYLRQKYSLVDNFPIFSHTIKPMLGTVRINPLLVSISKDLEISPSRWKNQDHVDIITNCARLSAGCSSYHEPNFDYRLQGGNMSDKTFQAYTSFQSMANTEDNNMCTSSFMYGKQSSAPTLIPHTLIQENFNMSSPYIFPAGISPPETAVEATPETTPIKVERKCSPPQLEMASSAKRALNCLLSDKNRNLHASPIPEHSPVLWSNGKEQFKYPPAYENSFNVQRFVSNATKKLDIMLIDRNMVEEGCINDGSQSSVTSGTRTVANTTIVTANPIPVEMISPICKTASVEISSTAASCVTLNSEDIEVRDLMLSPKCNSSKNHEVSRCCDSVLQELPIDSTNESADDFEEYMIGSKCMYGGLHMPDSRSLFAFANQVQRLRHNSCNSDSAALQTLHEQNNSRNQEENSTSVIRRTTSCPNINRSNEKHSIKKEGKKDLIEEMPSFKEKCKNKGNCVKSQVSNFVGKLRGKTKTADCCTQTEEVANFQNPYESLFLDLFQPLKPNDNTHRLKISGDPEDLWKHMESPSKMLHNLIESTPNSIKNQILVKGSNIPITNTNASVKDLNEQLLLMSFQLQFEELRCEVHVERNKQLLQRAKNMKALEDYNSTLRDRISLMQKELENSAIDLRKCQGDWKTQHDSLKGLIEHWKNQSIALQKENRDLKDKYERLEMDLRIEKGKVADIVKSLHKTQAALLNTGNELKCMQSDVIIGKKYERQMQFLQREVLKAGEIIINQKQQIQQLKFQNCTEAELDLLTKVHKKEILDVESDLKCKNTEIDAFKVHCSSLQEELSKHLLHSQEQKQIIESTIGKHKIELKTLKEKYEEMKKSYNKEVEVTFELQHKLSIAKAVNKHSINQKRIEPDDRLYLQHQQQSVTLDQEEQLYECDEETLSEIQHDVNRKPPAKDSKTS